MDQIYKTDLNELFSYQRKGEKLEEKEKVIEIEIERLRDFKEHPFHVKDDKEMSLLKESIKNYGILSPLIVRPVLDGVYEIVSGHRRKYAAQQLGYYKLPVIIRVNMGIKVSNLVMEYKKGVKSLDHVNLNIDHGIYGLLGENGAGKTTLMKILVTLLTPTSGTAEINGLTVEPKNFETIKKQIGYLPQEFGLYPNLTVRESLEYVGIMSGVQFMKSLQSKMFILWTERSATLPERW